MDIQFTGQITQQDFLQAQALHRKASKTPFVLTGIFIAMLVVMGIASLAEPALVNTVILALAILALIVAFSWGALRLQAKNVWKNSKSLQKPLSGTITADKIDLEAAYSAGSISWEAFIYYKQSEAMILLYQSPNVMNIFAKAYFKDEKDWQEFKTFVEKNVPQKKPTFLEKSEKSIYWVVGILLILLFILGLLSSLLNSGR